jgi:hypothetical protein
VVLGIFGGFSMPLFALTAAEALRRPTVIYNAADGSGRTYGANVENVPTTRPAAPAVPVLVASTTGGTLLGTTSYSYVVSSVLNGVESLPSTAATVTSGAGSTNKVTLTLATVSGITLYNVYGRTSSTEAYIMTVDTGGSTVASDTGAITPAGAKPSGALAAGSAVLRIPSLAGGTTLPRNKTILAVNATTPGEAGKYEYRRS